MRLRLVGRTALALALLYGATSCKSDSPTGSNNNPTPTISISLSGATLTIKRGQDGSVTVTLNRGGGYTGPVSISVEGAPSGATATVSPSALSGSTTTAQITIAVGTGVAIGGHNLTVRAQGSGVSAATATLSLNVTAAETASFTLAVSPATASVAQGGSVQAQVAVTRANFTGEISFAASGLPSGMTAGFAPVSTTQNASTLTLAAAATVTPGTYTVTVRGTATGASEQTATLQVTVTQSAPGGNMTYTFCTASGLPTWFAYQDGTGQWTQVLPGTGNTYAFTINSNRGGVAWVDVSGGDPGVSVFYGLTTELAVYGPNLCEGSGTVKTVNGSVTGLGITDQALITMGGATATVQLGAANFTLTGVHDGITDLIASRLTTTIGGGGITFGVDKLIILRAVNPAPGSTMPVLDFNGSQAFTPDTRNVTVTNGGTDLVSVLAAYLTEHGSSAGFFGGLPAAGATHTFPGVPAANQATGDLHLLTTIAIPDFVGAVDSRSVQTMFKNSADKTVNLGPTIGSVTPSVIAGAPYPRLQTMYTAQPEYNRYFGVSFGQANRQIFIAASSGYAGTGSVTLAIPDFTGATGWDPANWALASATQTSWVLFASGWSSAGGFLFSPFVEGGEVRSATRQGTINTN